MTESPVLPPVGEGTPAPPGPVLARTFPVRWAVAGLATVGVIGAVVVGWLLFGQPRVDTASAAWLPSDTAGYIEVSADLTAGERDQVLALLKKFPGFADQANLGDKLDESFQRVFAQADFDYRAQVKPWLGDSVALAMRIPAAADASASGSAHEQEGVLLVATTDDTAAAGFVKALGARAAEEKAVVTSETDHGVAITFVTPASGNETPRVAALAVVDGRFLAGDADLVRAVIAVRRSGAPSLATEDTFRSAIASLPADRVGALWLDMAAVAAGTRGQLQTLSPVAGLLTFSPGSALVGSLRAEDDGVMLELNGRGSIAGAALLGPSPGAGTPHRSRLAESVPADATLFVEVHDIGATAQSALAAARLADPSTSASIEQLDKTLALAGTTLDQLTAAIGDGALVATVSEKSALPHVALLVEVKDVALATRLVSQADALLGLSGFAHVTTRDYRGITLHRAETTSVTLPGGPAGPTFALAGDVLIVGLDEDLVVSIIDARRDGTGLGVDPDYTAVSERIGAENNGALYVDLETLVGVFGGSSLTAEERAFLAPFRQLGLAASAPGEHEWLGTSRLFVRIK